MQSPDVKNPLGVDSLAAETSRGCSESDRLSVRLERYSSAKKRALENLRVLRSIDTTDSLTELRYRKGAVLLADCGNYLAFRDYYTVNKVRLYRATFCKQHLICPLCAIRRGSKTLEAYIKRYRTVKAANPVWRLSMLTLTVKNGDDLAECFGHLQNSVRRIFDRRRDWLKKGRGKTELHKVHGWVGTYEVTNKGNGWHPHAHIMVLHTATFDYVALQSEWKEITGDSHVLNVIAAKHPNEPELDFLEVFKYAVKFSDLNPEQNIHAWDVLRGRRLLFSGGALRGVEIPEELNDEPLDDLPYIELFYLYVKGRYIQSSQS